MIIFEDHRTCLYKLGLLYEKVTTVNIQNSSIKIFGWFDIFLFEIYIEGQNIDTVPKTKRGKMRYLRVMFGSNIIFRRFKPSLENPDNFAKNCLQICRLVLQYHNLKQKTNIQTKIFINIARYTENYIMQV